MTTLATDLPADCHDTCPVHGTPFEYPNGVDGDAECRKCRAEFDAEMEEIEDAW